MDKKKNTRDYITFLNKVRRLGLIDNEEKEYYGYITAHHEQLKCLYEIYQEGMTFIDLGCGAGNVLRYADNIGYKVTGVEFNLSLCAHLGKYDHINKDIKTLDEDVLNKYDVIYCYRPLKDDELKEYLNKVIGGMSKGSYLIIPDFKVKDSRVTEIKQHIYKK